MPARNRETRPYTAPQARTVGLRFPNWTRFKIKKAQTVMHRAHGCQTSYEAAPASTCKGSGMSVSALSALRQELVRQGLDEFIVPRADEHLGEYVPASAERLAWLTGFTGSAGLAVVLAAEA